MLFQSWTNVLQVLLSAVLVYPALIVMLRISGKRTLGKMNAFDLVVTVAVGSTLATVLLPSDVTVAGGVVALGILVGLQAAATWLCTRSRRVARLLKSAPTLLLRDGELLNESLRSQRVTEGEIRQAVRSQGLGDLSAVAAVVLEADGTFSVIASDQAGDFTALESVDGFRRQ